LPAIRERNGGIGHKRTYRNTLNFWGSRGEGSKDVGGRAGTDSLRFVEKSESDVEPIPSPGESACLRILSPEAPLTIREPWTIHFETPPRLGFKISASPASPRTRRGLLVGVSPEGRRRDRPLNRAAFRTLNNIHLPHLPLQVLGADCRKATLDCGTEVGPSQMKRGGTSGGFRL
jgi:hypothetical protein